MASPLPTFDLQELIGAGKRAIIRHRGRRYLLTLTRRDRLILTLEEPRADGDEKA